MTDAAVMDYRPHPEGGHKKSGEAPQRRHRRFDHLFPSSLRCANGTHPLRAGSASLFFVIIGHPTWGGAS